MKKLYTFSLALGLAMSMQAQTVLLNEDFTEAGIAGGLGLNSEKSFAEMDIDGWYADEYKATADLPSRWCLSGENYSTTPNYYAYIDFKSIGKKNAVSTLYTPAMQLNGTCQLSFSWYASPMGYDGKYDMMVYVCDADDTWKNGTKVWDWLDADMLLESGVQPTQYDFYSVSWVGWNWYNSKIDLTPWQGKNIKVAFVYKQLSSQVNLVKLDNVKVEEYNAVTTPVAEASISQWDFGEVYIGSKMRSDIFTLTNTGTSGMKITSVECPDGFSLMLDRDIDDIDLKKNESLRMQIAYAPQLTSAAKGDIVINVNGVGTKIAVTATKKMLSDDAVFEGFEGETFPPAGWTASNWKRYSGGIEGDWVAASSAYYEQANYLMTPRIDGTKGPCTIEFSYADFYNGEEEGGADTTVKLEWSSDGGNTWQTVDTYDYTKSDLYNAIQRVSFTRTADSDNCYWRWTWSLDYYDYEYGADASLFYLDAVVLNNLYGAFDAPEAATNPKPAHKAKDIYNRNVTLSWDPVQFADGYRLYVGTDANASNIIDGKDLGTALSYSFATLDYATTYRWKVVPYNANGDAENCFIWNFTTIDDPTITELPYSEGFDDAWLPKGWNMYGEGSTRWDQSKISPYDGDGYALAGARYDGSYCVLETPDIVISKAAFLTFYWGDGVAVSLVKDETNQATNNTVGSDGISELLFQVSVDGGEWTTLSMLSDKTNPYWIRERFDMAPYIGHKVAFRWYYNVLDYYNARGASLDMISIEEAAPVKLSFNTTDWNAGKLNYNDNVSTGDEFVIYNDGSQEAEIATISFPSPIFTASIAQGDKIPAGGALTFSIAIDALMAQPGEIEGNLVVTTTNGAKAEMPVSAVVLAQADHFFGFEWDENNALFVQGLTFVDEDKANTWNPMFWKYSHKGEPMAFMVLRPETIDVDYPPHTNSGKQLLINFANNSRAQSNDWIFSEPMVATENSEFEFYARNYESLDTYWGEQVGEQGNVTVYVTENIESITPADYEDVFSCMLDYPVDEEYTCYNVDLSEYAGKTIRIALRIHTDSIGLAYLFDDLMFHNFSSVSGIEGVISDPAADTDAVYYNLQGIRVPNTTVKSGVYLRSTSNGVKKVLVK